MGKNLLALGCLLVAGCSGSAESSDDDDPIECSAEDRLGTYLLEFTELDGDCGPLPDQLVRITGELSPGCTIDGEPTVSDDSCKVENSLTCIDPDTGQALTIVGVTTQETDSGSVITGTATITLRDVDGALLCLSTYLLRYERQ